MPQQDTIIYWDGYEKMPSLIYNLPAEERSFVLQRIAERREELSYSDPTFTYIFILIIIIVFGTIAWYSRSKKTPAKQ